MQLPLLTKSSVYVLEFLLGQYCSSDDPAIVAAGVENVKRILSENYVRPDESQLILAQLRERGAYNCYLSLNSTLEYQGKQI